MQAAKDADAILFGSVGGPKWDKLGFDLRPEIAILRLRKELDLFANLRPAIVLDPLVDASTLKPDVVRGLDLMIVRESTGGIYFGEPRGIETLPDGQKRGFDTETYTTHEIERVARVAFELARKRQNRVCQRGEGQRDAVRPVLAPDRHRAARSANIADVELSHMYADNCAMQLVRNPRQFDVIVTSNIFGDLLSDLASMLTGSLGMLPSATLGAVQPSGKRHALYEPIHGSAPDIAGKGIANPLAQMLSFAMLLRYSFGMDEDARLIERAATTVLASGPAHGRSRRRRQRGGHAGDGGRAAARARPARRLSRRAAQGNSGLGLPARRRRGRRPCVRAGGTACPARTRTAPGPAGSRPNAAGGGFLATGSADSSSATRAHQHRPARAAAGTGRRPRRPAATAAGGRRNRHPTRPR